MLTESTAQPAPTRSVRPIAEHVVSLLDAITDAVTVHDASGQLVHANAAAAELLGASSAQELLSCEPSKLAVEIFDASGSSVSTADLAARNVLSGTDAPEQLTGDHTLTYANRAACQHYGLTAEQLRGAADVPPDKLDFTEQHLADDRRVLESGKVIEQRTTGTSR